MTDDFELEVDDESNVVDRKKKAQIVNLRSEIDEYMEELEMGTMTGELTEEQAMAVLNTKITQYLMHLEPLLKQGEWVEDDDGNAKFNPALEDAGKVYFSKPIGKVQVNPPRDFVEQVQNDDIVIQGDEPEPQTTVVNGLKEVIETERVSEEWEVQIRRENPKRGQNKRETVTLTNDTPLNKVTLRNAVRVADSWLQQHEIGIKMADEIEETDPNPY